MNVCIIFCINQMIYLPTMVKHNKILHKRSTYINLIAASYFKNKKMYSLYSIPILSLDSLTSLGLATSIISMYIKIIALTQYCYRMGEPFSVLHQDENCL